MLVTFNSGAPALLRFLLSSLLLLLTLAPSTAAASICAPVSEDTYSFTAANGEFGFGALRSANGMELLADVSVRLNARVSDGRARSPWRVRLALPSGSDLLLSLRSRRLERDRELDLQCGASPFAVYLPYHANPPPARS